MFSRLPTFVLYRLLMRVVSFFLVLVFGLLLQARVLAQEVPLEQVDRDTYTFSTTEMALITEFIIEGPNYHITDDPYQFKLVALTSNLKTDTTVSGFFPFLIIGEKANVRFRNGEALVEMNLGKAKELHVQLADTNLEKTKSILRRPGWPALVGVALFLLLTWFFRHALARGWRKLTGDEKAVNS